MILHLKKPGRSVQ